MPIYMFIHGGLLAHVSKRDFSYVADTIPAAGGIAAIVDYAPIPSVRMAVPVDQLYARKLGPSASPLSLEETPERLTASGHSAGAHLCAWSFADSNSVSGLRAALLLGGLYDLKPLQSSFRKPEIGITWLWWTGL